MPVREVTRAGGAAPGSEEVPVADDRMVVIAKVRLRRVIAPSRMEWPIGERLWFLPGETAIVRISVGYLGQIAAGCHFLVEIEDKNPAVVVIHCYRGKPLGTVRAGPAVQNDGGGESQSPVRAPLKRNVRAVVVIVIGVDNVDVALGRRDRVIHGHRRESVDSIIAQDLVRREKVRGNVHGRAPSGAVVGGAGKGDVPLCVGDATPPGYVGIRRTIPREGRNDALTYKIGIQDLPRRPGRRISAENIIGVGRRNLPAARCHRREIAPGQKHTAGVRIHVDELLVRRVERVS